MYQQSAHQRATRGLEKAYWHASVHHPVQSEKGVSHIPLCHTIRLTNDNAPYKIQKYILTINFFLLETLSVLQADAKFSETWHLIVHRILPAFKACKNTYWNQGKSQISGYYCIVVSHQVEYSFVDFSHHYLADYWLWTVHRTQSPPSSKFNSPESIKYSWLYVLVPVSS